MLQLSISSNQNALKVFLFLLITPLLFSSCKPLDRAMKEAIRAKKEYNYYVYRAHDKKNIIIDQVALINVMPSFYDVVEKITNMNGEVVYRAQTPCNCSCAHTKYNEFPKYIEILPGEYSINLSEEYYTCGGEAYSPWGSQKCVTKFGRTEVPGKKNIFKMIKRLKAERGVIYTFSDKTVRYMPIDFTIRESSAEKSFKYPQKFIDNRKKCTPID